MIKLNDLYVQTRLAAGDLGKRTYSDFEIKTAVDAAVSMLEDACVGNFSDILVRSAVIVLDNGVGKLPDGFLSIEQVGEKFLYSPALESYSPAKGEYAIRADSIYCDEDEIKITYHKSPDRTETEIDLPHNILFSLARLAANILKEEFEAATERAKEIALTSKRRETGGLPDPEMWGA